MSQLDDDLDRLFDHGDGWGESGPDITCKFCGARRLKWYPNEYGKFRLYAAHGHSLHQCGGAPASPDDFDDLTK